MPVPKALRGYRNCKKCGRWRPASDFRPYKSRRMLGESLYSSCRHCEKEYAKDRFFDLTYDQRAELRERTREHAAARRRKEGKPVRNVTRDGYGAKRVKDNIGKTGSVDAAPVLRECSRAGWSVNEIAQAAGVDPRSVSRWSQGERMSLDAADRLCMTLGLHLSLIYGCE